MRNLWFIIVGTFLIQEITLTIPVLGLAKERGINMWLLFILWVIATGFDVLVGYVIGKWIQRRFQHWKFKIFLAKKANILNQAIGKRGKKFALSVFGLFYYPYAGAFAASWMDISLRDILLYLIVGDSIWFGINVGVAYGIFKFTSDIKIIIGISIVISMVIAFFVHYIRNIIIKSGEYNNN